MILYVDTMICILSFDYILFIKYILHFRGISEHRVPCTDTYDQDS